jgi:hypothetical protein
MQEKNGKLWFDDAEIDSIVDEALIVSGHPRENNGIATNIDAFVKARFGIWPEPESLPANIHGATKFFRDGKIEIRISQELTEKANEHQGSLHRYRTTVAHEVGHALLHRHLYISETLELFGNKQFEGAFCKKVELHRGRNYDWKEWQANQIMARILMPKRDLVRIVSEAKSKGPCKSPQLISLVSEAFMVSGEASKYRLEDLKIIHQEGQLTMVE